MSQSDVSLTSDFDYLKIAQDATLSITTTTPSDPDFAFPVDPFGGFGFGEQGVTTITHGLGTVPLVRAFIKSNSGLWYSSYASIGFIPIDPNLLTLVDTSTLKLCVNSGSHQSNVGVFYRIYKPGSLAIDSDDRIDKIFSKGSDAFVVTAAPDSADAVQLVKTYAHNQGEPIIWTMQFSADGTNWYNDGSFIYGPPDTGSGPPGGPYAYYYYLRCYAEADDNTFYIRAEHNYPSTQAFYVRWSLDYRT